MLELSSLVNWAALLASLFVSFYLYARYKQTYWSRRGVYSPPCSWLFGHFRDAILLRAAPPFLLGEIHKSQPGLPVVGVYIFQQPFLLLRSPDIIKQIFVKDFHLFSDRYFASKRKTDVIGSANLFSIDNPEWKYLRTKLSPAFTSGKQKKLFNLMLESADNMRKHVAGQVPEDERKVSVEVRNVASRYTTDVITSLSFGVRTNSFVEPELYARTRMIFDQGIVQTSKLFVNFFFPKLADLFGVTFLGNNEDYMRKIFWESMNDREKSGLKRGDVIDLLLELKNEKQSSEFRFEGDHLFAQTVIFLVAGLETSSITMSFALLELAAQPDLQARVRDEIRRKIGHDDLTYEAISQMSYLQQVVSETLRLHAPAALLDRVALQDYKIPDTDIVIEKGTVVYVTLNGLHEDPDYHTDPQKFDPDRFSEERKPNIKPCSYMPFGEGPRICIGMRTGILQTMVGLITILKEYEVSLNPSYKNEVSKRAIFMAPSNGIHLYLMKNPVV